MKFYNFTIFYLLFFVVCTCFGVQAQTPASAQSELKTQSIDEGSIDDQFEFVIKKATNWRDEKGQSYEVIKRNMMLTLKAHTLDTFNAIQARLNNTRNVVNTQQSEIEGLKTQLAETQGKLDNIILEKDSMSLFGIQMSKTGYSLLMWSIIGGLIALLAFFITRFKHSNIVTKATKNALADMENEFKEHRKTAMEREQKVKRELQDMINKYEN